MKKPYTAFLLALLLAPTGLVLLAPLAAHAQTGDETVSTNPVFGKVGAAITITVTRFPPSTAVSIFIGGTSVGATVTNSAGTGTLATTIPEIPGGFQQVQARVDALGLTASTTISVLADLQLRDAAGILITSSTYITNGSAIRVLATGFGALEEITVTDDGNTTATNVVLAGYVTTVTKGSKTASKIIASASGAFDFTYATLLKKSTGTSVSVSVTGVTTGFLTASYLAVGAHAINLGATITGKPNDIVTLFPAAAFSGLIVNQRYSLLFDGGLLILTVEAQTGRTWFTSANSTIKFTVPATGIGIHLLTLVFFGQATPLAKAGFIVSLPATVARIQLAATTETGVLTGEAITRAIVGQTVSLIGVGFAASETGITGFMVTSTTPASSLGALPIDASGAGRIQFTVPSSAGGVFQVYVRRTAAGEVAPILLTVAGSLSITPISGPMKATIVTLTSRGLAPTAAYVVVWDVQGALTQVEGSVFTTNSEGAATKDFTVPGAFDGTYSVSVAPAAAAGSPITPYNTGGEISYPRFTVKSNMKFLPTSDYVAYQMVFFSWSVAATSGGVFIELDGAPILTGTLSGLSFNGSANSASVKVVTGTFYGTFIMPNGPPNAYVEVKVTFAGTSTYALIRRISGAGSLILGVDLAADLATIKTSTQTITTQLSALDARLVTIQNGIATLQTSFGPIKTGIDELRNNLNSVLNTLQATLKSSTDSIRQDVATVRGAATDIRTSVTDLSSNIDTVRRGTSENANYLLILSGLTVVQIVILVSVLVVVVRKK